MLSVGSAAKTEWPTLALFALVYLAFGLLTWFHASLPLWLFIPLGAYLSTLHSSLQHETLHGHPTTKAWLNEALATPGLWLWIPFRCYRKVHLTHHQDENLTCPVSDPESQYVHPDVWAKMGPVARGYRWANNTLLGRLLISPWRAVFWSLRRLGRALVEGDRGVLTAWAIHLVGATLVLGWAVGIAGVPLWLYFLTFVYFGLSGSLLRSFLEHRARPESRERTVAVEAGPLLSLMFLNNNLHALHHSEPGLAWYRLPARWRERREELLAYNGEYRYAGYWQVALSHLVWPKEHPAHPGWERSATLKQRQAATGGVANPSAAG
jgi:fatty acid desaturase